MKLEFMLLAGVLFLISCIIMNVIILVLEFLILGNLR